MKVEIQNLTAADPSLLNNHFLPNNQTHTVTPPSQLFSLTSPRPHQTPTTSHTKHGRRRKARPRRRRSWRKARRGRDQEGHHRRDGGSQGRGHFCIHRHRDRLERSHHCGGNRQGQCLLHVRRRPQEGEEGRGGG
ncbi:hypothetical protein BU24DRAFT_226961 [Aaosphaeria arxii CBS 175.79]|uniref:Uncharacterized protein n=1 Tax=Aaosphaeria arxii CBS 175.79 TaxID=1450172 RepID=A0A6A5XQ46_9PLEO|nr:uncharacterized protein BU24DRAFT_226961 [Aaosphaeria arxii CBS 175.79]KAF2015026.1 hypothetical protein BU24DRAFT_226961 [Aaosphaeria arxii CBS 175.79]